MARKEGQPVPTEFEERKKLIEPRLYDSQNPLNRRASETVSLLRHTLETKTKSCTFDLPFNEPPYFLTEKIPHRWGFRAEISYAEIEDGKVSINEEGLELYYSLPDDLDKRQSFTEAEESDRLESVRFRINADYPRRIWVNPGGRISVIQVEILDWQEKETPATLLDQSQS